MILQSDGHHPTFPMLYFNKSLATDFPFSARSTISSFVEDDKTTFFLFTPAPDPDVTPISPFSILKRGVMSVYAQILLAKMIFFQ